MATKSERMFGHLEWILTVYRLIDNSVAQLLSPICINVLCKLSKADNKYCA